MTLLLKCPVCAKKTEYEIIRKPGNNYDDWMHCHECGIDFFALYLN